MEQSAPVLRSRIIAKDGWRKTLSLAEPQRSQRKSVNSFPPNPEKARILRDSQPARIICLGQATIDTMIKTDIYFAGRRCEIDLIADLSQSGQIL